MAKLSETGCEGRRAEASVSAIVSATVLEVFSEVVSAIGKDSPSPFVPALLVLSASGRASVTTRRPPTLVVSAKGKESEKALVAALAF